MSGYSDLIDIKFTDTTTYSNTTDGDVLGAVIDWYWGPANELTRCNSFSEFLSYFPAEKSCKGLFENENYREVYQYFQAGGSSAEIWRYVKNASYYYFGVSSTSSTSISTTVSTTTTSITDKITLKYPGIPPESLMTQGDKVCSYLKLTVAASTVPSMTKYKSLTLYIGEGSDTYEVESYDLVSFEPGVYFEGKSIFVADILKDSDYLAVSKDSTSITLTDGSYITILSDYVGSDVTLDSFDSVPDVFSDIEMSLATWFIGKSFASTAMSRKDTICVCGYPTTNSFDVNTIKAYKPAANNQFATFVAARVYCTLINKTYVSQGIGAWIGHQCVQAQAVRINQIASAKTYGAFTGVLAKTLLFKDVLTLHDNGINSIYQTATGAYMFGVRTCYGRLTSYYGKLNVMRVVTRLLRDVFPSFIAAIHTDTASNALTRKTFGIAIQSIVNEYIANQNLKEGSVCDVGDTVNNDFTTKSGTVLNAVFRLWFIGLVERIKINIVATDSTVSAEIE